MPRVKSRAGVYYDKSQSPYAATVYGATFKFSSQKKLEIFNREFPLRIERLEKAFVWINQVTDLNVQNHAIYGLQVAEKLYNDLEVDKWQDGKRVRKISKDQVKQ